MLRNQIMSGSNGTKPKPDLMEPKTFCGSICVGFVLTNLMIDHFTRQPFSIFSISFSTTFFDPFTSSTTFI
jgi:hypothetical protein